MTSSGTPTDEAKPTGIEFDDTTMWVSLEDGRTLGVPLSWFPVLKAASPEQRKNHYLSPRGLHWDEIDEDISVRGLLDGRGDMTNRGRKMREAAAAKLDAAE